ncbi:EI24 domain-containing protein [Waterburya agarophytonicola K14]|uniref:EI24 domain-containing protein n=1 Tax=Waterburya agarophytonicola KI4 TaxID=2874699 RepID=A0A964FEU0_9CYAN|nr:EI24 domain-containing protein [Waterburya agarophytonicola KI4]
MKKVLGGFGTLDGATYPFKALMVFIRNPRLIKYIAIPILLNIVVAIALYSGLLYFGWQIVDQVQGDLILWLNQLINDLPQWLGFLTYTVSGLIVVVRFLLIVILFIATGFVLTQFGVLLGAPWYGQLSEQLEKLRTGKVELIELNIVSDLTRAILYELKKLVLIASIGIPLLAINFFPGVGTLVSSIGSLALTTTIVCMDFLDSCLERRRLKFRQKLGIVLKSLPASASLGLVCLGLISIPLVNLVTIPLCVASGTLFICDRVRLPLQR